MEYAMGRTCGMYGRGVSKGFERKTGRKELKLCINVTISLFQCRDPQPQLMSAVIPLFYNFERNFIIARDEPYFPQTFS
jgi:hypothetical protein